MSSIQLDVKIICLGNHLSKRFCFSCIFLNDWCFYDEERNCCGSLGGDSCCFDEEALDEDHFVLSQTIQIGIVMNEDDDKIRLVHSFSLDDDQHDFINIPKSLIKEKVVIGWLDIKTAKIVIK